MNGDTGMSKHKRKHLTNTELLIFIVAVLAVGLIADWMGWTP
jgi:hypothetical protein